MGSFTVRAHAGVNRLRFRGRFRGRTLPAGGYRLVIRARGAKRDAAAVPIVIAKGHMPQPAVRKALHANTCSEPIADVGFVSVTGASGDQQGPSGGRLDRVKDPVVASVGGVAGAAREFANRITGAVEDNPLGDPIVLAVIGLFLVVITLLATLLLAQIVRAQRLGEP